MEQTRHYFYAKNSNRVTLSAWKGKHIFSQNTSADRLDFLVKMFDCQKNFTLDMFEFGCLVTDQIIKETNLK